MALTEQEMKRCERDIAKLMELGRRLPHVRPKLDFGSRIGRHGVELFEIRPDWTDPETRRESPFARASFVRTRNRWRVFRMRADLKWHGCQPRPELGLIEELLDPVHPDESACFFASTATAVARDADRRRGEGALFPTPDWRARVAGEQDHGRERA